MHIRVSDLFTTRPFSGAINRSKKTIIGYLKKLNSSWYLIILAAQTLKRLKKTSTNASVGADLRCLSTVRAHAEQSDFRTPQTALTKVKGRNLFGRHYPVARDQITTAFLNSRTTQRWTTRSGAAAPTPRQVHAVLSRVRVHATLPTLML